MGKVDKDTETELRRLATAPGHDRIGMMAKGCIVDLLDELVEFRASQPVVLPEPEPEVLPEPKVEETKGKSFFKSRTKKDSYSTKLDSDKKESIIDDSKLDTFFDDLDKDDG